MTTKIPWTDRRWNCVTGCSKRCGYCYALGIAETRLRGRFGYPQKQPFNPTFHPDKLNKPYGVSKRFRSRNPYLPLGSAMFFVNSMGEFFDKGVKREWQDKALKVIEDNPQHIFQILTKVPENIPADMVFPKNVWLGVTVDREEYFDRVFFLLDEIKVNFVSFEPLLTDIPLSTYPLDDLVDWVIVGGLSGKKPFIPPKSWIDEIVEACYYREVPLFIKNNAHYPTKMQEFPVSSAENKK